MFKKLCALWIAIGVALSHGMASAAVDLTAYTVDVTTVETLAGIILTGLAAMWGIRKLIKVINHS